MVIGVKCCDSRSTAYCVRVHRAERPIEHVGGELRFREKEETPEF